MKSLFLKRMIEKKLIQFAEQRSLYVDKKIKLEEQLKEIKLALDECNLGINHFDETCDYFKNLLDKDWSFDNEVEV